MQKKQQVIVPKSMQQDLAVSQFPADAAYEIRNMRIVTTGNNTSLCLTSEKGNSKELTLENQVVIGCQEFLDKVILFCTNPNATSEKDSIYKIEKGEGKLTSTRLTKGDYNFSVDNPIESVAIVETDKSEKVYWVDGNNYPRVIDVLRKNQVKDFDFNPSITNIGNSSMDVELVKVANSLLPGGVIQYVVSYYNLGLQQTPTIIQSPLYYTSQSGRGLNPDGSQISDYGFKITLNTKPSNFEYIKVYRILRTSIDATPTTQEIKDIKVDKDQDSYTILDNGTGIDVDPTELLYLGGDLFSASTLAHKDNTLFLGNIVTKNLYIDKDIKTAIKEKSKISFSLDKLVDYDDDPEKGTIGKITQDNTSYLSTQWIFNSNLEKGSDKVTFFQKGEVYRFGVQFLSKHGNWSDVVFLEDVKNDIRVKPYLYNDGMYSKPNAHIEFNIESLTADIKDYIKENYVAARPVCVYPTVSDRNVLCQGIVCPTIYNIGDRSDNSPYVQSSWFARPSYLDFLKADAPYINNADKDKLLRGAPLEFRMFDFGPINEKSLVSTTFSLITYKEKLQDLIPTYCKDKSNSHIAGVMLMSWLEGAGKSVAWFNNNYNSGFYNNTTVFTYQQWQNIITALQQDGSDKEHPAITTPVQAFSLFYNNSSSEYKDHPYINNTVAFVNQLIYDNYIQKERGVTYGIYLHKCIYANFSRIPEQTQYASIPMTIQNLFDNFIDVCNNYYLNNYNYVVPWIEEYYELVNADKEEATIFLYPFTFNHNYTGLKPTKYQHLYDYDYLRDAKVGDVSILSLPSANRYNGEIYGANNFNDGHIQNLKNEGTSHDSLVDKYQSLFGIDTRIVTMHSPELDGAYDDSLANVSLSNLKFRVVGYVPVKRTYSDVSISSKNNLVSGITGMYHTSDIDCDSNPKSLSGYSLVNFPFWLDGVVDSSDATYASTFEGGGGKKQVIASFPVYPWQRKGSLGNQSKASTPHSELTTKTMSNLRVCLPPAYFDNGLNFEDRIYSMDISNVEIWQNEDNNSTIKKLNTGTLWGTNTDIVYKGNIDKILPQTYENLNFSEIYTQISNYTDAAENNLPLPLNYNYDELTILHNKPLASHSYEYMGLGNAYPVDYLKADSSDRNNDILWSFAFHYNLTHMYDIQYYAGFTNADPIPVQYKSTGHAVFAFDRFYDRDDEGTVIKSYYNTLPLLKDAKNDTKEPYDLLLTPKNLAGNLWQTENERYITNSESFKQHIIPILNGYDPRIDMYLEDKSADNLDSNSESIYYYLIGELYREDGDVVNRFGGDSESALALNTWLPCGKAVYFSDIDKKGKLTLVADQGDTYLERYDHLKTYPLATDNVNNIVEIVSFPCETRINIDGRYDRNRGNKSNIAVSPTNFNLFNKVYSQQNSFFNYNYLDTNKQYNYNFPTQVTWSKTKTLGEDIDTWTSISLASVTDLDGDKGNVNSLKRFNNEIYSFQDKGISRILFNPRVQVNASDGVPIEITNSGKVEGKIYITDKYGCSNKWSIAETPNGLFFADNYNKSLMLFNGQQVSDISSVKNMSSWAKTYIKQTPWKPNNFSTSLRTLYDPNTTDVYFTIINDALAFNNQLGAFSSFYNYGNVSWLFNLEGDSYQIQNNNDATSIWKLQGNDTYMNIFGGQPFYSLSIISNADFQADKIFDTLEFRTNDVEEFKRNKTVSGNYPFDKMITTNEYQIANSSTDNIKCKFRTWRWYMGRYGRARIRNPWTKISLIGSSSKELRLYDMAVTYYL